jgi:hypothetical protein
MPVAVFPLLFLWSFTFLLLRLDLTRHACVAVADGDPWRGVIEGRIRKLQRDMRSATARERKALQALELATTQQQNAAESSRAAAAAAAAAAVVPPAAAAVEEEEEEATGIGKKKRPLCSLFELCFVPSLSWWGLRNQRNIRFSRACFGEHL